jgi:hypothetical protein
VAIASWLALCLANPSEAAAEDHDSNATGGEGASEEGSGEETDEKLNSIAVHGLLALQFEGMVNVGGGGNVSYERELIPKQLQMELTFGVGSVKSLWIPINLVFTHAWVPNEVWEPDVGFGGTVTIEGEKNASGGRDFTARFGITFVGATHIWLGGSDRQWGLNLALVYTLQVTRGVTNELFLEFGPAVRF